MRRCKGDIATAMKHTVLNKRRGIIRANEWRKRKREREKAKKGLSNRSTNSLRVHFCKAEQNLFIFGLNGFVNLANNSNEKKERKIDMKNGREYKIYLYENRYESLEAVSIGYDIFIHAHNDIYIYE